LRLARLYGNRERNGAASSDPCKKWEHNSEDDEHDDGAGGIEVLVPQKEGEGAGVKDEAADKNSIVGKMPGAICGVSHFSCLMR
jgi:hypothetical protein